MKITDYAVRAGALDAHLRGHRLHGIEIGCDAGAHAEALLRHCSVERLVLVDIWDNDYYRGYCMGRLQAQGWKNHAEFVQASAHQAAPRFRDQEFDFIYLDIVHDLATVAESLSDWWPKLKQGGLLGYRNYTAPTIQPAIDQFVAANQIRFTVERYHNEIILFKEN